MLCMAFSMPMIAQRKTDSFFNYQSDDRGPNTTPVEFFTKEEIGINNMNINPVPLGNGLLVLSMISTLYFIKKRKETVR